ncbi:MAG TPA: hypothetical protein VNM87_15070, partial [Candidatus Udaeobacter sp.]|nr:hypothetical protein [Candidatus Udaeobacter sp.]
ALGTCGHLIALRRESIGGVGLTGAVTSEELASLDREIILARAGMSISDALGHLAAVVVSDAAAAGVRMGRLPAWSELKAVSGAIAPGDLVRLEDPAGELLAVVEARGAVDPASSPIVAADEAPFRFRRVLARPLAAPAPAWQAAG